MIDRADLNMLPPGYEFEGYTIDSVLGTGGFGITYRAHETAINRTVAIKEFFPASLARRDTDRASVRPETEAVARDYYFGVLKFQEEAETLARFRHPNIVSVHRYFEANGTAYIVMEYEEGESLSTLLSRRGTLAEDELTGILRPLLDGLEAVHNAGFLHRDIKPDNVFIRDEGGPVLLDFGAARQALAMRSTSLSLTAIITPYYAPHEQYDRRGNQGPWTDIYALGATLYHAVAGEMPDPSPSRIGAIAHRKADPLVPASQRGQDRYAPALLDAIDAALRVLEHDRPQSIAELRALLDQPTKKPAEADARRGLIWGSIGATVVLAAGAGAYLLFESAQPGVPPLETAQQVPPAASVSQSDRPPAAAGAEPAPSPQGEAESASAANEPSPETAIEPQPEPPREPEPDVESAVAEGESATAEQEEQADAPPRVEPEEEADSSATAAPPEDDVRRRIEEELRRLEEARREAEEARRAAKAERERAEEARRLAEENRRRAESEAQSEEDRADAAPTPEPAAPPPAPPAAPTTASKPEPKPTAPPEPPKATPPPADPPPEQQASVPPAAADPSQRLTELFAGGLVRLPMRQVRVGVRLDQWTFRPDGTVEGTALWRRIGGTNLQEDVLNDTGRWWIDGGRLCLQWTEWDSGEARCYTVEEAGDGFRAGGTDGLMAGDFTIER